MNFILVLIVAALQWGDWRTTTLALRSGKFHEANGIMARLFARYGMGKVFLWKGIGLTLASAVIEAFLPFMCISVVVLYLWVVGQNLWLMWRRDVL